ncbi:MAG TPA: 3-deoxy-7-phosphoheptulonate synthase [Candidatus Nitrosotenuis sp.]|nr:3-deoxy-7-phosphoheptulonate synthase [Candidatus Nitrosotenuis sp.]
MLIVAMQEGASIRQIGAVCKAIEDLGRPPYVSRGSRQTLIGCMVEEDRRAVRDRLETLEGVERVFEATLPYRLAGRELHPESTVLQIGGIPVGGRRLAVMAGPCAVESHAQMMAVAETLLRTGVAFLRGGAFKPRTSPYSFQGLGERGLEILAEVRHRTGLLVVTEVLSPQDVELVARHADVAQVGARNMQNFALLQELGRARIPVLLKRGMMNSIDELLLSAEYILSNGNTQVMLCERGIRTFEKMTRNTLDISAIPVLRRLSHLPVIVDPSHAAGDRDLVPALTLAAVAAGADGILVEIHPDPARALSDGPQSLTLSAFEELMRQVGAVAAAVGREL